MYNTPVRLAGSVHFMSEMLQFGTHVRAVTVAFDVKILQRENVASVGAASCFYCFLPLFVLAVFVCCCCFCLLLL